MKNFTFVLFNLLLDIKKVSVVKRKKCCVISDGLLEVFPGSLIIDFCKTNTLLYSDSKKFM